MKILLVGVASVFLFVVSSYSVFFAKDFQRRELKYVIRDGSWLQKKLPALRAFWDWQERYTRSNRNLWRIRITGIGGYLMFALLACVLVMLIAGRGQ